MQTARHLPNNSIATVRQIPEIAHFLNKADHVDIKTIEGDMSLREFLAGIINYNPGWIQFLFGVRMVFVRFLGMKQDGIPKSPNMRPEDVSFTTGEKFGFFDVINAEDDRYYLVSASDSHLTAYLAVTKEALVSGTNRFYVVTIVHYHNWAGPVYFNVIRPFHHMVVRQMIKAGIQQA